MAVWGGQKGEVEVSMGQKELHESRKYDDDKNKEDSIVFLEQLHQKKQEKSTPWKESKCLLEHS